MYVKARHDLYTFLIAWATQSKIGTTSRPVYTSFQNSDEDNNEFSVYPEDSNDELLNAYLKDFWVIHGKYFTNLRPRYTAQNYKEDDSK